MNLLITNNICLKFSIRRDYPFWNKKRFYYRKHALYMDPMDEYAKSIHKFEFFLFNRVLRMDIHTRFADISKEFKKTKDRTYVIGRGCGKLPGLGKKLVRTDIEWGGLH